jgi:hypothetical protein
LISSSPSSASTRKRAGMRCRIGGESRKAKAGPFDIRHSSRPPLRLDRGEGRGEVSNPRRTRNAEAGQFDVRHSPRPPLRLDRGEGACQTHSAHSSSACASTVFTASSCKSGG